MGNIAGNFFMAKKLMKDREYILQTGLLTALEVLKNDFGFSEAQLETYSNKYVSELRAKLAPGAKNEV